MTARKTPAEPVGPKLTKRSLGVALLPPNNCGVARFRDALDKTSLAVFDEAIGYQKADFSAIQLREWLVDAGFDHSIIPPVEHIHAHRIGRKPCRCRG